VSDDPLPLRFLELRAQIGELDFRTVAVKQIAAELLLQELDRPRQGWLGDIALPSGLGEAQVLAHREEIPDLMDLHTLFLSNF
jgi:hypothetical protein